MDQPTAVIIAASVGCAGGLIGAFIAAWSAYRLKSREATLQRQLQANKGELDAKLEKAKGEIAADLKVHETRLRVASELKLSMHAKSFEVLANVGRALRAADFASRQLLVMSDGALAPDARACAEALAAVHEAWGMMPLVPPPYHDPINAFLGELHERVVDLDIEYRATTNMVKTATGRVDLVPEVIARAKPQLESIDEARIKRLNNAAEAAYQAMSKWGRDRWAYVDEVMMADALDGKRPVVLRTRDAASDGADELGHTDELAADPLGP